MTEQRYKRQVSLLLKVLPDFPSSSFGITPCFASWFTLRVLNIKSLAICCLLTYCAI